MDNKTAIIIPARYGSSRLEGKPLLKVLGKSIIQWVYEKAQQSKYADMIIVATDDKRIYDEVASFGGNAEMTSVNHKCGSDRIMEVVSRHPEIAYICNLQGDEPLIKPESIDAVLEKTSLTLDDIKYVVCHQANYRIIRNVYKKMKSTEEKFYMNLQEYGNTSAASIPLALGEMNEKGMLNPGDKIICVGFGGGLTWGATLIAWS